MGWANCGEDSKGRPIGYAHSAKCDHPQCDAEIDRGLAYACGGMHGEHEYDCERYFCEKHLSEWVKDGSEYLNVCEECAASLLSSDGGMVMDEEEGVIVRVEEI